MPAYLILSLWTMRKMYIFLSGEIVFLWFLSNYKVKSPIENIIENNIFKVLNFATFNIWLFTFDLKK